LDEKSIKSVQKNSFENSFCMRKSLSFSKTGVHRLLNWARSVLFLKRKVAFIEKI